MDADNEIILQYLVPPDGYDIDPATWSAHLRSALETFGCDWLDVFSDGDMCVNVVGESVKNVCRRLAARDAEIARLTEFNKHLFKAEAPEKKDGCDCWSCRLQGDVARLTAERDGPWTPTHRHCGGKMFRELVRGFFEWNQERAVVYDDEGGGVVIRPEPDFHRYFTPLPAASPPPAPVAPASPDAGKPSPDHLPDAAGGTTLAERIEAEISWLRDFASAHHAGQDNAVLLHSLTVDIPSLCDAASDRLSSAARLAESAAGEKKPEVAAEWITYEGLVFWTVRVNEEKVYETSGHPDSEAQAKWLCERIAKGLGVVPVLPAPPAAARAAKEGA